MRKLTLSWGLELGLELRPLVSRVQALNTMSPCLSYKIWFLEHLSFIFLGLETPRYFFSLKRIRMVHYVHIKHLRSSIIANWSWIS